jgi:hypothetical protein
MPTINLNDATPAAPAGYQNVKWQAVAPPVALAIVGVTNAGGLFKIALGSTDDLVNNDSVTVVCPAFPAIQGQWQIGVVDGTHCTLQGSVYSAGWTSFAGGIMLAARDVSAYTDIGPASGGSSVLVSWDETPAGTVNGFNVTFTLANAPSPAASLQLFQDGVLQIQGTDYTLSGNTITFMNAPGAGSPPSALLNAFYRYGSTIGTYVDAETPGGAVNGFNVTFTLANAPSPTVSLRLYDNGVFQVQGTDYTLSGATITFANAPTAGDQLVAYYVYSASTSYADAEVPSGTVNGLNVTFGLAHTPNPAASLDLYVGGIHQLSGSDFTLSSATITFASAPSSGAILTAFYRYV